MSKAVCALFQCSETQEEKYLCLKEVYEETLREKQEAIEEQERATISFAVHFDREVSVLDEQIERLTKERDKANTDVEDLQIKLENTKYELNRLQREHIKLQLEQEKCLDKIEQSKLQKAEGEKQELQVVGLEKEFKVDRMESKDEKEDENLVINTDHHPRAPVVIKKSKIEDDYHVHEELGRGKFGVVKKVIKKGTDEEFAAKWVKVSSQTKNDVLKEIEIMGKLDHKRLVGLFDAYEVSRSIILVMEFITGGELFERIANEESVTEKECAYYMRQLLEGLQYMHKHNIVHLDLKPENIVCISKDTCDIKLIDFGLAKELKPGTTVKTMQGTPEFVAPEIINYDPVCLTSDMWSVGVIAYILVSGLSPFLGDDDNETLAYVSTAEYDFEDEAFQDITHEAKDFIAKLIIKAPSKRKSAEEALKHEWIKKNKGQNKIKTDNLKKFLAKRRWQKSVNAVRAVRRLSSMTSLLSKEKSKSTAKLVEEIPENNLPTMAKKRELSKSTPSVFQDESEHLSKRAIKILQDSDAECSEFGSVETLNVSNVDDNVVLEGLFKENKEILEFLAPSLEAPKQISSEEKRGISKEGGEKPSILQALAAKYTVPKGTPVVMTCTVAGHPTPNVTWSRDGTTLNDGDSDINIDFEDNVCTFSVAQCELQDEGSYLCVAENEFGKVSCNTRLDVQVPPEFVQEMKDVAVEERRRVQFDVVVSGKPYPSVEWYRNKSVIQEDRVIKIRKTEKGHSLVIRSATAEQRGRYKCVISNSLDRISCSAVLHIQGYSDEEEEEESGEEYENDVLDEEDDIDSKEELPKVALKQESIELYYDIKDEIGKGRFGVVRYGIHKATGRDYAIKYVKVRKSQKEQLKREIDIMNHLRHRRFIRLYEAFEEPRRIILVLELMRGGDLLEQISEKDHVSEKEIVRYVKQILEGVKDMHLNNVLHLDLKPQNIMFTTSESGNLKLIDFGLAQSLDNDKEVKVTFGTPEFVAPEIVNYDIITPATDMWSVGVITYILLSGVSPFWNADGDITLANVTKATWGTPDLLFQGVSNEAKDFLSKILMKDPSKRMKVEEAFDHPWIKIVQNDDGTGSNLISTERLKKYYAHQKGLLGSSEVTSLKDFESTKENERKENDLEEADGKMEKDSSDSDSRLDAVTKERNHVKEEYNTLVTKHRALQEEMNMMKSSKEEREKAFSVLEKRNKLLEERNTANQEASRRLIKLECDKKEIEEKCQQREMKLRDLSKKYDDLRVRANSYNALEEKVVKLENEKRKSLCSNKMLEEQLEKLLQENEVLQMSKAPPSTEESVLSEEDNNINAIDLQNKIELLSKDLEIARAEIRRLSELVKAQHEDLEEMERVTEQKRKLETRCKGLEEQLVELEEEGAEREKEIDEMEDDISDLQAKVKKSHKELRVALNENKKLKGQIEVSESKSKTEEVKVQEDDVDNSVQTKLLNGFYDSHDDDNAGTASSNDEELSAKLLQLDKGLQTLLSNGGSHDGHHSNGQNELAASEAPELGAEQHDETLLTCLLNDVEVHSAAEKMDMKQLQQLSKRLMKTNEGLLKANETLNRQIREFESKHGKQREEMERKMQNLEAENGTFKRLLKAGDSINAVDDILNKATIEALESELTTQKGEISNLKKSNEELEQRKMEKKVEEENVQWRLEQKIKKITSDKTLLVTKYEKELEECQSFYLEEQNKLKRLCDERIASVEKQNQNLKSQINELSNFNDNKMNTCEEHTKQLNDLERLHQEEVQELEKNLALTLSQELHILEGLAEQEKRKIRREGEVEISKLTDNCKELNETIASLQEQARNYPELHGQHENLKNELTSEKQRYELLEKELGRQKEENKICEKCAGLQERINNLESEMVALRKFEDDNMHLTSENEKLLEEIKSERRKLELAAAAEAETEAKMKLEELDNEKNPSTSLKEGSKKSLKKRISQLDKDCKDLTRKLQSEVLKGKQQQIEMNRETSEKERLQQTVFKIREAHKNNTGSIAKQKLSFLSGVSDSKENSSDVNDYQTIEEELKESQNRTYLLQTEIDRLRESYSNNLSKELEEMENKWTQRLRRECNAVHSEMAKEMRKEKECWRRKESQLHSVIKELQIQVEEIERERRQLEEELKGLKGKTQNGGEERLVELPVDKAMKPVEDDTATTQEMISDRDLRRVAYKLKKDQWSRLGTLLGLTETDIHGLDQHKVGKEEKAFRMLCQWRKEHETNNNNQVSQLASALEAIRRKDLGQFVTDLFVARKTKKKLIGW